MRVCNVRPVYFGCLTGSQTELESINPRAFVVVVDISIVLMAVIVKSVRRGPLDCVCSRIGDGYFH